MHDSTPSLLVQLHCTKDGLLSMYNMLEIGAIEGREKRGMWHRVRYGGRSTQILLRWLEVHIQDMLSFVKFRYILHKTQIQFTEMERDKVFRGHGMR